jgi:hypothetical protein
MPKISELPESTALAGTEYVPAVQGSTVKVLVSRFATYISSLYGSGVPAFLTAPTSANLKAAVTDETGSGPLVFATNPTLTSPALVTPDLGTPTAGVATNLTGTAAGLTAGNVTTNANLTGPITSVGNITSIASQTGTGTKFVVDNAPTLVTPTLVTPILGAATATSINKVVLTAPATSATLALADGTTVTGPPNTGTLATVGNSETFTGTKTFGSAGAVGRFRLAGNTSGTTVLDASAIASGTVTVPAATTTLVGKDTTDVLTNKTFNSAATGNVLQVSGVTVSAGQYPGETTTGSATAGNVGEVIAQNILVGSAVSLTSTTVANVATITLTAGDWDIEGQLYFGGGVTTQVGGLRGSISTTTGTENAVSPLFCGASYASSTPFATFDVGHVIAPHRVSLSGSQQYWLVVQATFSVSTCKAYGQIRARRAR